MSNYETLLTAAKALPPEQRWQLIDELCDVDSESDVPPLSEEWRHEIERRVAEIKSGKATTVPW